MRIIAQTEPDNLQLFIDELKDTDPEIYNFIKQNNEQFITHLNIPFNQNELNELMQFTEEIRPNNDVSQETDKDREAIDNLTNMGFDREIVAYYYNFLNKDAEATANYLFDNM